MRRNKDGGDRDYDIGAAIVEAKKQQAMMRCPTARVREEIENKMERSPNTESPQRKKTKQVNDDGRIEGLFGGQKVRQVGVIQARPPREGHDSGRVQKCTRTHTGSIDSTVDANIQPQSSIDWEVEMQMEMEMEWWGNFDLWPTLSAKLHRRGIIELAARSRGSLRSMSFVGEDIPGLAITLLSNRPVPQVK